MHQNVTPQALLFMGLSQEVISMLLSVGGLGRSQPYDSWQFRNDMIGRTRRHNLNVSIRDLPFSAARWMISRC
jgi:hypothetical protein